MQESQNSTRDYSLRGAESITSVEKGLADASWYLSPVSRENMQKLLVRRDGPAIIDSIIWFSLLIGGGVGMFLLWGTWWFLIPFFVYSIIYGTTSDSRWHESSHGTAFKTDWMNNALYEIASFMVIRQSTPWRWSHTRHHSDTIIRGRDPEISVQRPPNLWAMVIDLFAIKSAPPEFMNILLSAAGKMNPDVATFLPESEYYKVFFKARIYIFIYLSVFILAIVTQSWLPLMYVLIPNFVGTWLMRIYGTTQHAALAENVLDHRLNCRTVYMNRIHRYLYWNMNYHVEHHMYPLVPYHALPALHELIKDDCPTPYSSIWNAYQEIIPALIKQSKDPEFYVKRELPLTAGKRNIVDKHRFIATEQDAVDGWVKVCGLNDLAGENLVRFDCDDKTFAVYHTKSDAYYATDGICTHGNTHLADGFIKDELIECPKHNGRFSMTDGSPQRAPVCVGLSTYQIEVRNDLLWLDLNSKGGSALKDDHAREFRVVSNENVATYTKELVLEPIDGKALSYKPGEYIQIDVPKYSLNFAKLDISKSYQKEWKENNVYHLHVDNRTKVRRNYSMATNPDKDDRLVFNVRIALPPPGVDCNAGVGSSYVFGLKTGDILKVYGPFGDFHIRESQSEMVYLGGGAGMAPLKSHLSHLFETQQTMRKVSFWYGARSKKDVYYQEYFEDLASEYENFNFEIALSEPKVGDDWNSHTGFIHQVLAENYLKNHPNPAEIEFYLCGPPAMTEASISMLKSYGVSDEQIAFDEF